MSIPTDVFPILVLCLFGGVFLEQTISRAQEVCPVLEFPQANLDDPAAYDGYTTRFFRDSSGNTVQIGIQQKNGRLVHLWANASNESLSFTARTADGQPALLHWDSPGAIVSHRGKTRVVEYTLLSRSAPLYVGLFLLGSMRKERNFQAQGRHHGALALDAAYFEPELLQLLNHLDRLPSTDQQRQLHGLKTDSVEDLRARLRVQFMLDETCSRATVVQPTFDGVNLLAIELRVDAQRARLERKTWGEAEALEISSLSDQPLRLTIAVATDSPSLTPLPGETSLNQSFWAFYQEKKAAYPNALRKLSQVQENQRDKEECAQRVLRFRWLDRHVQALPLLSSQEKLMAGLPNFATYFGRDTLMTALMMEPIWSPAMLEHAISSVLRKLSPAGEVSHEEALGGQAMRENASLYNSLMTSYFREQADPQKADELLERAEGVLSDLQSVRENYQMIDDDFQLPVLVARYLGREDVSRERKRQFMTIEEIDWQEGRHNRLSLILRNLHYLSKVTHPYVQQRITQNLVSFRFSDGRWLPGSWRDSGAGYARGRFAMDVNAVWAPQSLQAMETIFAFLSGIRVSLTDLKSFLPEIAGTELAAYAKNPELLRYAIGIWRGAIRHFEVHLSSQEIERAVEARLRWLPETERSYWQNRMKSVEIPGLHFLALSLDAEGRPIPVLNTDCATWLFLDDLPAAIARDEITTDEVLQRLRPLAIHYPVGLRVDGLGPLVANDLYASPEIWETFRRDHYHSPRVVWGREVNLLLLGLHRQITLAQAQQAMTPNLVWDQYIQQLRSLFNQIRASVEASGLQHNELWTYQITDNDLVPLRYSTSSDIQLWNLTDLVVQFLLEGKR